MDFIKRMKKREFIEMGLKTLAAVLAAFLAIILMEGMIYGIKLNALKTTSKSSTTYPGSSIAYCIKESEDKYFVVYCNETKDASGKTVMEWSALEDDLKSKDKCLEMEGTKVKEVVFHAPNAFDFSITSSHYIVMAVFVSAIVGFFAYKFIVLAKAYKKTEEQFIKTGTIEITNI